MKKTVISIFLLLFASPSFAATWYIRSDGASYGTSTTTCNGHSDVAYSAGNGPNCAVKSLYDIHTWTPSDSSATSGVERIAGGDIIIFSKTGDTFPIGADRTVTPALCTSAGASGCYFKPFPSGPSSSQPTKILGVGYDTGCAGIKVQLYGTQGVKRIFDLSGKSNIDIECLELTDHSNCGLRVTGARVCSESWGTDVGAWGRTAIYSAGGTNFTFSNLDIHGLAFSGMNIGGVNGLTLSKVNIDGNHTGGWDGDIGEVGSESAFSGTINILNSKIRFNGCSENYPRSSSFSASDYLDCGTRDSADGAGFYNTGGIWNVKNSEFSHNSSDGLDLLYCNNNCTVNVDKSLFEGNWGNQLKFTAKTSNITNSIFIANCRYLVDTGKVYSGSGMDCSCRANGTPIVVTPIQGSTFNYFNNTAWSSNSCVSGSSFVESANRYGTCNGSEVYTYKNNILYSATAGSWVPYYNGLSGSCSTAWGNAVTQYSNIYNFQTNPSGTGNLFTAPPWTSSIGSSTFNNVPAVYLTTSRPGTSGLSFWNTATDYNSYSRGSSPDMGALQRGSTPPSDNPTCGNNLREGTEVCDGIDLNSQTCITKGYASGTLSCNSGCSAFVTSACVSSICGNNVKETGELCDGTDLNSQTCITQGFNGGSLTCNTGCGSFNTSACTSTLCGNGIINTDEVCEVVTNNSFPSTDILDSFNRDDEVLDTSSNWTEIIDADLAVISGVIGNTGANKDSGAFYNGTCTYCDSYAKIATKGVGGSFFSVFAANDDLGGLGYVVLVSFVAGTGNDTIKLYRWDNGYIATQLEGTITQEIIDGDTIGISVTSSGVKVFYNGAAVITSADTNYVGTTLKQYGFEIDEYSSGASTIRIDDYGGGTRGDYLLNGETCSSLGFSSGTLTCSSCAFVTSGCTSNNVCGGGSIGGNEQCDDGNLINGDGCSAICQLENPNYQLLLNYTKLDPGINLGVETHKVSMSGLTHTTDTSLRYDFGANYFSDFTHRLKVTVDNCYDNGAGEDGGAGLWAMSSSPRNSLYDLEVAGDGLDFSMGCLSSSARYTWQLYSANNDDFDSWNDAIPTLLRYVEISRTGTALTAKIYSDSNFSTLLHTLSVTTAEVDYRYFYTSISFNSGTIGTAFNGSVDQINLDAGEEPATPTFSSKISGTSFRGNAR